MRDEGKTAEELLILAAEDYEKHMQPETAEEAKLATESALILKNDIPTPQEGAN